MHTSNIYSEPEPSTDRPDEEIREPAHDNPEKAHRHGPPPGKRPSRHHRDSQVRRRDYSALDLDSKLIWNFRDIGHTLLHSYEGKGSQQRILIVLDQTGPITQSLLTTRLGIQPGSASEVLSKMEHAGYITRTPSKSDQRTSDVILTEAGKTAAAEAKAKRKQRHDQMFESLSDMEKVMLLSMLEQLNREWQNGDASKGEG